MMPRWEFEAYFGLRPYPKVPLRHALVGTAIVYWRWLLHWRWLLAVVVAVILAVFLIRAGSSSAGSTLDGSAVRGSGNAFVAGVNQNSESGGAVPVTDHGRTLKTQTDVTLPRTIRVVSSGPVTRDAPEPLPPAGMERVEDVIRLAAQIYGVDTASMLKVAFCESRFDYLAANPTSDARGLFQHIGTTWTANVKRMGAPYSLSDRTNPVASSMVAGYMIAHQGLGPWAASEHCWGKVDGQSR